MADRHSVFDPIFQAAGEEWNIDWRVLKAMSMQESPKGDPRAVSPAGALGLMQLMPKTARDLGVTNPFEPVENIFAGAKYLNEALEKEGNLEGALLYYHGGPGWRQKWGTESAGYVPAVAGHYKALLAAHARQQPPTAETAPAPPVGNPDINPGTGLVDPAGTLQQAAQEPR